ncbi:MAG: phosphoribosyltransferase, partial [Ignavibacteria bacterium]
LYMLLKDQFDVDRVLKKAIQSYTMQCLQFQACFSIPLIGDYAGKHILIIEDIIDSGRTITELKSMLETANIASCTIVSLFSKPDQHQIDLSTAYIGFTIPAVFIIGYGLDYQEQGRELPGIWQCID